MKIELWASRPAGWEVGASVRVKSWRWADVCVGSGVFHKGRWPGGRWVRGVHLQIRWCLHDDRAWSWWSVAVGVPLPDGAGR